MIRSRKINAKPSHDGDTNDSFQDTPQKSFGGFNNQQVISNPTLAVLIMTIFVVGFYLQGYYSHRSGSSAATTIDYSGSVPGVSLIPPDEDAALAKDKDGQVYHLIFSTDCGTYQHWQSYMTFYRAMRVKQTGHVTRIASGCTPEEKEVIEAWFDHNIRHMSNRFHLMLTPHFSQVKDDQGNVIGDYKFFNKPHGLKFWLEHSYLLDYDGNGNFPNTKDHIVILIDPDMSMMRPINKDFTSDTDVVISKNRMEHLVGRTVEHGKPFAQTYGFASQFLKLDLAEIGGPDSPLLHTTHEEGRLYYPAGPPYIATVTDAYEIAKKWTEFVPKVHKQYPHLLAEMFAYSLAAAHLDLKFQLIQSLMISDTGTGDGEGWALIDQMPAEDVCRIAREADYTKHPLPHVVHLCQRYSLGKEWFFGKRKIPHDVFDCASPLFEEPPDDVATKYDFKWPPNGEKKPLEPKMVKREAFMICHLTRTINDAAEYYKRSACGGSQKANLNRSMKIADLFK